MSHGVSGDTYIQTAGEFLNVEKQLRIMGKKISLAVTLYNNPHNKTKVKKK